MNRTIILSTMQGYKTTVPRIKKVVFVTGKIELYLQDGRALVLPLTHFPSIKKLSLSQRNNFTIINNGTVLNIFDCEEIFHIRDFLGLPENWAEL